MVDPGVIAKVDTISSLEAFEACRDNWRKVHKLDQQADYFLSWDWLSQLYQTRDEGVFILAAKISETATDFCAFFPLRQEVRYSESRQVLFNSFSMAGNYWADSTGLICNPEFDHIAIPALANALKALAWRRILFESLKISSQRKALLFDGFASQDYSVRERTHTDNHGITNLARCPYIVLPDSFEQYLQSTISANTRQKLRRIQRKIVSEPELSIELATTESLEHYLNFFQQAWIENWKEMKGRNAKRLAGKYAEFIRIGFHSGNMLIPVLLDDSRPVGMLACYTDSALEHLLFFVAGRDVRFKLIPGGLALHAFTIEWAIANGYKRYDLLRGDESYKYSLGAIDGQLDNIEVYRRSPSPEAQLLVPAVFEPALSLVTKLAKTRSKSRMHSLYSQLLESWPGNTKVGERYADWLEATDQLAHAHTIRQTLQPGMSHTRPKLYRSPHEHSIDIHPFTALQDWVKTVTATAQAIALSGRLQVKGLDLQIAATEPAYFRWLRAYLNPLTREEVNQSGYAQHVTSPFRINCINADGLVIGIMRLLAPGVMKLHSLKSGGRRIERCYIAKDLVVDICRAEGIVWLSNTATKQLTIILSSRVVWPALEISRTTRAVIIAYLQQEGWLFMHSGAVRIDDKNYLIIGDEGKGKTSLLLALMSAGCQYISNERVFVRKTGDEIEALAFPMPVAIGMGTAQQYSQIMAYVYNPEICLYPHRRMDTARLRSTPESRWETLPDKVQLLVTELVEALESGEALQGGAIAGVIVPDIVKQGENGFNDQAHVLKQKMKKKIVRRNHIAIEHDSRYPAWLPLAFEPPPTRTRKVVLKAICSLPGIRFEYFASQERSDTVLDYPSIIQSAINGQQRFTADGG